MLNNLQYLVQITATVAQLLPAIFVIGFGVTTIIVALHGWR